jgi:hypothetical protein
MNRTIKTVTTNLKKLSVEQLRAIKELVIEEISDRELLKEDKGVYCRLFMIVAGKYNWRGNYSTMNDYEEKLKGISKLTEKEFCQYRGVGRSVLKAAKIELQKRGLSFKTNDNEQERID